MHRPHGLPLHDLNQSESHARKSKPCGRPSLSYSMDKEGTGRGPQGSHKSTCGAALSGPIVGPLRAPSGQRAYGPTKDPCKGSKQSTARRAPLGAATFGSLCAVLCLVGPFQGPTGSLREAFRGAFVRPFVPWFVAHVERFLQIRFRNLSTPRTRAPHTSPSCTKRDPNKATKHP